MDRISDVDAPTRVVVAGGGVAAVETVLALRALAGDRVTIELVAPGRELVHRPLAVLEPFDGAEPQRLPFSRLEATHGVHHRPDLLVGVDVADRRALLAGGGELPYDVLVIATGARPIPWLPSALTFTGSADVPAFREVLDALEHARASHVLFAAPPHVAWSLPLYELALLTTTWLVDRDIVGARLTLATPDPEPLSAFGASASRTVRDLLSDRGIELVAGVSVPVDVRDGVTLGRLGRLRPDRIVTLPRLVGRPPAGLQGDADGFIPVDDLGAVLGADGVYAVGDAADHDIKQGGLATQQADVAATAIAADLGVPVRPRPFQAILRGVLLTGVTAAYLREGGAPRPRVAYSPSWSAPLKIAARHLSSYLAAGAEAQQDDAALRRQAVEFAQTDARRGDMSSALEWLAVAERLGGELDETLIGQRESWQRELGATPA
jgi:sulfide:quinone oxidoreductase